METNATEDQVMKNEEEETKRCTNCSRGPQPLSVFTKDGKVLNRCLKCREKDSKRSKRPDVRERKYAANKIAKPWIKYREREREKDEQAFLDHNNEVSRKWREDNPEHINKWYRNSLHHNYSQNMRSAKKKGIPVELSEEEYKGLMQQPCTYCGFLDEKKGFGGVDRMDSKLGYTKENAASCCKTCNYSKLCLDPVTFINRARHIASVSTNALVGEDHSEAWPDARETNYWRHKASAAARQIECTLSSQDHERLVNSLCEYCEGKGGGIDRKDSNTGYMIDNCVPCCTECNYMKKTLSPQDFRDQMINIAEFWEGRSFDYRGPVVVKAIV
jgi:hypothetical protein